MRETQLGDLGHSWAAFRLPHPAAAAPTPRPRLPAPVAALQLGRTAGRWGGIQECDMPGRGVQLLRASPAVQRPRQMEPG